MARKKQPTETSLAATKQFTIDGTWAIDPLVTHDDILICAQLALFDTKLPMLQSLQQTLPRTGAAAHGAMATGAESNVAWATWHHGKDFYTYWCGDVASVLHNAHLTDTEREKVLLRARKAEAQGARVFATGAKFTHQVPHTLEPNIEHIGLVFARQA